MRISSTSPVGRTTGPGWLHQMPGSHKIEARIGALLPSAMHRGGSGLRVIMWPVVFFMPTPTFAELECGQ